MSVTITCDECKHDIRDGDEVICYPCYESLNEELKQAEEEIEELKDDLDNLNEELARLRVLEAGRTK